MGVREAQDGKPWLLLDVVRNLVQRLSNKGTVRRWWVGVVWEEPIAMVVALLMAAVQAMKWYRREREREHYADCISLKMD